MAPLVARASRGCAQQTPGRAMATQLSTEQPEGFDAGCFEPRRVRQVSPEGAANRAWRPREASGAAPFARERAREAQHAFRRFPHARDDGVTDAIADAVALRSVERPAIRQAGIHGDGLRQWRLVA